MSQKDKKSWVRIQRLLFSPSDRSPCFVCGKYKSLTHAHHLIPLAKQACESIQSVDNRHVWLCPTHHSAIHILLGARNVAHKKQTTAVRNVATEMSRDCSPDEWQRLLYVLGNW